MSAANYIIIKQIDHKYEVHYGNASTGHETVQRTFNNLEDAARFAQGIMDTEIVEYGISFSLQTKVKGQS